MNIQSTFEKDIPTPKSMPGAYEWWYFDAISDDDRTELVVIFYEGNPFSRRYIKHQQNGSSALPAHFPAISISIYQDKQPIYYSFTEVDETEAYFGADAPSIRIENHSMSARIEDGQLIYTLELSEQLPSGDAIEAFLKFKSSQIAGDFKKISTDNVSSHQWHIIQPKAQVEGQISCLIPDKKTNKINFSGQGYHDHNVGFEPLKKQFNHWYWGRFHFKNLVLIYYLMGENQPANKGWLLDNKRRRVVQTFDDITISDYSRTLYGLQTARKIGLKNDRAQVTIHQSNLLDDGPFYQRFSSEAFLSIPSHDIMESKGGITEYLNPPRIYKQFYWPLTNMRIRYKKEDPHWVQRSKMLYRWTW